MVRKFKYRPDEMEWRAKRALLWCGFEGTEVQDAQIRLFKIVDRDGDVFPDESLEALVCVMESQALACAREYLEDQAWGWDDSQKKNFLLCMRHLRATGELLPELERKSNL